jgi:hypothetical protein
MKGGTRLLHVLLDEEEKDRAERTKKQRTKPSMTPVPINNPGGASPPLPSPSTPSKLVPSMPVLLVRESFAQSEVSQDVTSPRIRQKRLPMNLQRNPSIFGKELPQATLMSPKHAGSRSLSTSCRSICALKGTRCSGSPGI